MYLILETYLAVLSRTQGNRFALPYHLEYSLKLSKLCIAKIFRWPV